jgi:hypothetical protein
MLPYREEDLHLEKDPLNGAPLHPTLSAREFLLELQSWLSVTIEPAPEWVLPVLTAAAVH